MNSSSPDPFRGHDPADLFAAAATLGISTDAVKVAVHRLRKRFRVAVKTEIAQTVSEAADVREELDALTGALRG